jgi:predicted  nucleic acid-binding Zn-ribbon protein
MGECQRAAYEIDDLRERVKVLRQTSEEWRVKLEAAVLLLHERETEIAALKNHLSPF